MKPEELMHPLVAESIRRYQLYGWGPALIQQLLRRRFNVKVGQRCLQSFREGKDCTPRCLENCPFKKYIM